MRESKQMLPPISARGGARILEKDNYTFNNRQLSNIDDSNYRLFKNLKQTSEGKGKPTGVPPRRTKKKTGMSSAAMNRKREAGRIAQANAKMAHRLGTVKGTKALTRKVMEKGAAEQKKLAKNCRTFAPAPGWQ